MNEKPLVSVVIPTYDSEKTLSKCLLSIKKQSFSNIEIIVADSYSNDKTVKIAQSFRAKVVLTNYKLLGARYIGLKECSGQFVVLLDSDQILEKSAVERAVNYLSAGWDMLFLEEKTLDSGHWLQKLFNADRRLIHELTNIQSDPLEGVLLARVYRKEILDNAFRSIPKVLFKSVVAHDHAIIYYEAYKISQRTAVLPSAVWHIDPSGLRILLKKNFRYGQSTYTLTKSGLYQDLLTKKVRFRKGALKDWKLGLQTYLLLALKGVGYYSGYFSAKLRDSIDER